MLKTVVLPNIFVETIILFKIHDTFYLVYLHYTCIYCHFWSVWSVPAELEYPFIKKKRKIMLTPNFWMVVW